MIVSRFFLLDNTELTNFALVNRADLVIKLWGKHCATTTAAIAEYQTGIKTRSLPAKSWDDLTKLTLRPNEQTFANQFPPK
jgi:hypothetical protein